MDRVTHLILLRLGLIVVVCGRRWRHLLSLLKKISFLLLSCSAK